MIYGSSLFGDTTSVTEVTGSVPLTTPTKQSNTSNLNLNVNETSNRIGTVNNLEVGGTYDLLMVKVEGVFPEGKVSFNLYDVPMKITGLQKVVQLFLKVFLTSKGSDPFYPNRGTVFPQITVNANLLLDDNALLSDIQESIQDAARQVSSYNTEDLSSTLDSIEVLGIDRVTEGIFLYLQAKTLAGEFAAIALPFPEFGLTG